MAVFEEDFNPHCQLTPEVLRMCWSTNSVQIKNNENSPAKTPITMKMSFHLVNIVCQCCQTETGLQDFRVVTPYYEWHMKP